LRSFCRENQHPRPRHSGFRSPRSKIPFSLKSIFRATSHRFLTSLGSSVLRLFGSEADVDRERAVDELDEGGGGGRGGGSEGAAVAAASSGGSALVSLLLPHSGLSDDDAASEAAEAAEASRFLNSARAAASINGGARAAPPLARAKR
jgi:hypothetical protein